jgi:RimJ/RimL family protein N-acetyltransferase
MIDGIEQNLSLRLASLKDVEILLKWRNDNATRMVSHTTDEVKLEKHLEWLKATLQNRNRNLYVAEENGIPVGTVRADYDDGIYELSWAVSPEVRGQGIGKRMVSLLANRIKEPIRAEVKQGNEASSKIAEFSGMKFIKEGGNGVLHYQRNGIEKEA